MVVVVGGTVHYSFVVSYPACLVRVRVEMVRGRRAAGESEHYQYEGRSNHSNPNQTSARTQRRTHRSSNLPTYPQLIAKQIGESWPSQL